MPAKKPAAKRARKPANGFTAEEKAAMRERAREANARPGKDGERDVLAKLAAMPKGDRAIGERFHAIVKANAPSLTARTWYGMPAYAKEGKVLCFFQGASKFKARFATIGFTDEASLDEGNVWPTSFGVKALTAADEARIAALVRKAVG